VNDWKSLYAKEWSAGNERVQFVMRSLNAILHTLDVEPIDKYSINPDYIPYEDGHEKHDPDLNVSHNGTLICQIEVSGSRITLKPTDPLFILASKVTASLQRTIPTWFALVYKNKAKYLYYTAIQQYPIQTFNFKGRAEPYHVIPNDAYRGIDVLARWIFARV